MFRACGYTRYANLRFAVCTLRAWRRVATPTAGFTPAALDVSHQ